MNSVDAKNVLVIYHREDNDGVCSAAIVSQFLKSFDNPDVNVQFFGSNYAELSEIWKEHVDPLLAHDEEALTKTTITKWVSNFDQIYMVDISFSELDAMECIYKSKPDGDFIWCDHHRPIIEFSLANLDRYGFGNTPGIRRTDQSAILNTWEYMNNALGTTIQPSRALVMLSDYDYNLVAMALKAYILSDTSGFAPSIGQLVGKIQTLTKPQELNENYCD